MANAKNMNRLNVCIYTILTTGLTTGCIVYTAGCQTGCQTGCATRFGNRLNEQWLVERTAAVRSTRLSNRLYNRFDSRLYRVNAVSDICVQITVGICTNTTLIRECCTSTSSSFCTWQIVSNCDVSSGFGGQIIS